ncbi:MAG: ABC transporter permease [Acidobacteriota bacterium]|nr:ABC transporter permease [Acidobacteriota bacterium]
MRISEQLLYRLLLLAFPARLRRQFGGDMRRMFEEQLESADRSGESRGRLWVVAALDALWHGGAERLRPVRRGLMAAILGTKRWRWWVQALRSDVRYAIRMLLKQPAVAIIAIVTLALGIGANTAIFSAVNAVLIRPLPYPEPDRLVTIWERRTSEGTEDNVVSPADFFDWSRMQSSFDAIAAYTPSSGDLTGVGEPVRLSGGAVTPGFFEVFGVKPILGRTFLQEEGTRGKDRVIILGHALWRERFGANRNIVGQTASLGGRPYEIVGVLPSDFDFPGDGEFWAPLTFSGAPPRAVHFLSVYGRLKSGTTLKQASTDMTRIGAAIEQANADTNRGHGVNIIPLTERLKGPLRTSLWLLLAAVAFVLLIACVNIANLLLAKAATRRREVAVRAAVGAGRARLIGQMLTESVVLSLIGGAAGLLVARWAIDALRYIAPAGVPLVGLGHLGLEPRVLLFTLGLSLATGVLFGVLPAVTLAGQDLNTSLKDGGRSPSGIRRSLRLALVVAEIGLASLLLVAAGLTLRSFQALLNAEPGFNPEGTLTFVVSLPPSRYTTPEAPIQAFQQISERLAALPGVTAVGATSHLPLLDNDSRRGVRIEGREPAPDSPTRAHPRTVTGNYFEAMGITLRQGRTFTSADHAKAPLVAVINETMAKKYWPNDSSALGKRFMFSSPEEWVQVVGIIADVKFWGLNVPANSEVFMPETQYPWLARTFVVRTSGDPRLLAAAARDSVRQVDPALPVSELQPMTDVAADSVAAQRSGMLLLSIFGALALILAAAGIYGVMSHMVALRTSEIGIRMTLGAQPSAVMSLILKEGLVQASVGLALGITAGVLVMRAFRSLLYGVQPADPVTIILVAVLLFTTAAIACLVPARRAMRVDPVSAIRS